MISLRLGVAIRRILPSACRQRRDWAASPGKNYDRAAFRLWVPVGVATVRGVVVLIPGSNQDGRSQIEDRQWQALAARNNLALIGCYFTDKPHPNMAREAYADVSRGSGQALLDALKKFSRKIGRPELASAPLLLWGMSAGGQFNYEFVAWRPERVAGFVVNKGGAYYSDVLPPEARDVPGLFFVGGKDLAFRQDAIRRLFRINRQAGANWTLIEEPAVGHEIGASLEMARAFFQSIMESETTSSGSPPLMRVSAG